MEFEINNQETIERIFKMIDKRKWSKSDTSERIVKYGLSHLENQKIDKREFYKNNKYAKTTKEKGKEVK